MQLRRTTLPAGLCLTLAMAGCGGSGSDAGTQTSQNSSNSATVNLVVNDTPSTGLTVLSFDVQITSAVLQPGNVSILPRPVTVDLAQLASDTAFLASSVIDSATYTSLTISFANPQVTILNNTAQTVTASGQSCLPGATCTFTPALNNASVTISNGVFPLTVTASSNTGLDLDLSIPDLLQSDLSITPASGASVNLSLLSGQAPQSMQARIDDVLGTITAVSGTQVNITTALGDLLVLSQDSSTSYSYPASVCAAANATCLSTGQLVTVDLSLLGNGALGINSLSYLASSGSAMTKALVLGADTTGTTPTVRLLLQQGVNVPSLHAGDIATVSLASDATYAVGTAIYPAVSMGSFAAAGDLLPGQELVVGVGSDLVSGSAASFSTNALFLQSSQVIGQVSAVDTTTSSLQMSALSGLFTQTRPFVSQLNLQTDSTTALIGFDSSSLGALMAGQFIVAKGPLFNSASAGDPTLSAIEIRARSSGN